ncbi:MAG: hydrogenase formation protein HypD, partial [Deltaproteobacteria bacterium]
MKYIDEFRDKKSILALVEEIKKFSSLKTSIMEICGTHTHSVSKYGIRGALPKNIRLISGPGCPVCVTHQADIDAIIDFSRNDKTAVIATFGDMIRVPGTFSTLESERALGSDIRIVYSPLAALDIAKENPSKKVLFYSVGFE